MVVMASIPRRRRGRTVVMMMTMALPPENRSSAEEEKNNQNHYSGKDENRVLFCERFIEKDKSCDKHDDSQSCNDAEYQILPFYLCTHCFS